MLDEKAIIERIKLLRNQYSGDRGRSKFAKALGISASTYSYYENNRVPPIEILLKICKVTGANLNWLLTSEENIKTSTKCEKSEAKHQIDNSLLRKLDDLLSKNPNLTAPILAFLDLLCEKKNKEEAFFGKTYTSFSSSAHSRPTLVDRPGRPGWIPILGRTAAGMIHFWEDEVLPQPKQVITELDDIVKKHIGKEIITCTDGQVSIDLQVRVLLDNLKKAQANLIQVSGAEADPPSARSRPEADSITQFVQCEEIFNLFPDSFALHIDGDSMSPRIKDGDIVILSPSVPAAQGQAAIARVANQIGVTCKLLRSTDSEVHLIPINERYETKIVPKTDLLWALAVLCHITV